jgi:hypothetical protein
MRIREGIRATKQKFKELQRTPNITELEKQRQQLEAEVEEREQVNYTKAEIKRLQRAKWEAEHPMIARVREQIAQGGRQGTLEFKQRSAEFKEQNKLPGGVLGQDIPSLLEEQKRKRNELEQRTNN